jgi:hypothetical protein
MKKLVCSLVAVAGMMLLADGPVVSNVAAKQRYPWNGLVDITCQVTGIAGSTKPIEFAVEVVNQNSGDVKKVSHFWVVRDGVKSTSRVLETNGSYRLLWDAKADLDAGFYSNMIVRVTLAKVREKVQLWEDGPYWATTNIGAENPEDYGWYFWWGDIVGYKRENNTWVASDGSSSGFSFISANTPTNNKDRSTLQSEGWITGDGVLAPEHDAAHVQWGGAWRMPTDAELSALNSNCTWTWTARNGVNGYVVCGRGDYAANSIFIPASGYGDGTSRNNAGSHGNYCSSVPDSGSYGARFLHFSSSYHNAIYSGRSYGFSVRPVQGFTK